MENPWNIESMYELQFFNCPCCIYKNHLKQEIVNHAYETHPESIECLKNIKDKSLMDIVLPWNEIVAFESQDISKAKTVVKEEPHIKEELLHEDVDIPFESYNQNDIDANEEICEYGLSEETIEIKSKHILHQEKEMNPKEAGPQIIQKCPQSQPIQEVSEVNNINQKNEYPINIPQECQDNESFSTFKSLKTHVKNVNEGINCILCEHFCKDILTHNCSVLLSWDQALTDTFNEVKIGFFRHCKICNDSFYEKSKWLQHIKAVHEGEKEHECNHCGMSFSREYSLKRHVRSVHEGVKHMCNHCELSFSQRKS